MTWTPDSKGFLRYFEKKIEGVIRVGPALQYQWFALNRDTRP